MLPLQTYLRAVHHVCAYPTRRGFSAGSTPLTTRITSPFNDEVLTASAQQFFTNRQGDAGSIQHQHQHQHQHHHSQQHYQQGAPLISPPPGTILPRLHEITLWDVVRLFKVKEDMVGVESFPHLRTQSLLGHANKLLTRMQWGEARGGGVGERVDLKRTDQRLAVTPQDDAALHALAVHVGDRYALALGEGGGEWEGGWGTAAVAAGALPPSLPPQDDEVARLPNFSKQHLSPAIVAVVGCGAWPPTAIADVAATLGPRKLLSVEAEGALLKYASAVFSAGGGGGGGAAAAAAGSLASPSSQLSYPHPHPQSLHPLDAVNLILGLMGCSVEGVPPLAMDALFRASAPYFTRMCATSPPSSLSADGGENAATTTTTTTYISNSGNSCNSCSPLLTPILLPMPALAKLTHAVAARYGGDEEGDVPGGELHRLAEALGEACLGRMEAQQGALMGSGGGGGGGGAPLSTTAPTAAGLRGQEAVFAGYAISIARSLGSMGVFQRELLVALGEAWVKRWGSVCQKHISPATAGDALFLASLVATEKKLGGMGGGKSGGGGGGRGGHSLPHFPPLPIRLTAAWVSYDGKYSNNSNSSSNGGGGGGNSPLSLILIDGLGTGLRNRPPLYIPQRRPSAMVLAGAFAAAWEGALSQNQHQHQHQRGGAMVLGGVPLTSTARQILSCGVWRGNGGGACFVTPEGVALDVAVPGAKCGVRVLPQRALRPGKDGLRAGIGAEQGVLEASGWTVEYVLEADINSKEACRERAVGLAASLLEGAVRRKEESSNKGFVL